ncbi:sulfotransferase family protein [Actinomadura pelletieri DSM 43383]|uniref:Sulfotransferase family protein n=1 Tax=Actinomadura pelletieri DSM 43383 TaxID=1120940 RepID=A0A495QJ16_9ACTN|nr:sulfotransferase [Actinomadura pelletieri]RKS72150.1 sulfotransferase family protein [Actinomadura pelletieri DSM 43383]
MNPQLSHPIFVLGCPRSGTTLLQQMLHSHRRVAFPSETRFVHTSYEVRHTFGDLEREANRRALAEWIVHGKDTKFRVLGLDADETIEEIVHGPPTLGSALAIIFRGYARRHGKPRWGDKRPSYFRRVTMLRRLFPDAQFVHLVRDGRDAVSSLVRMPWFHGDIYAAALTWREAIDTGRALASRLGPRTFYELRYEDLVAEPEDELVKLCAFLGEDYDPEMTRAYEHARRTVPSTRKWHLRTHEAPNTRAVGAWRDRLPVWEADLVEHVLASRLVDRGYTLTGTPRPSAAHLARFHRMAAHRWRSRHAHAFLDRLAQAREPNPVVSRLRGPVPVSGRPDGR